MIRNGISQPCLAASRYINTNAELPEDGIIGAAIAEVEHRERTETVPELDDGARQPPHISALGNTGSHHGNDQAHLVGKPIPPKDISLPASIRGEEGPLLSASDLHPAPQSEEAIAAEETDFEYQARRLRERRTMIAKRKRLTEAE